MLSRLVAETWQLKLLYQSSFVETANLERANLKISQVLQKQIITIYWQIFYAHRRPSEITLADR